MSFGYITSFGYVFKIPNFLKPTSINAVGKSNSFQDCENIIRHKNTAKRKSYEAPQCSVRNSKMWLRRIWTMWRGNKYIARIDEGEIVGI